MNREDQEAEERMEELAQLKKQLLRQRDQMKTE